MALFFDTNILLHLTRGEKARQRINPLNEEEYISIVTVGEIRSIAFQKVWGNARLQKLEDDLFKKLIILDINLDSIIDRYVQIDVFSQIRHPSVKPAFKPPRNMGKNDIWIAATASFLEIPLVTTDKDFNHLHNIFVDVRYIDPKMFK
jgi:tRNA(fMet)-specific endonuclease VapC